MKTITEKDKAILEDIALNTIQPIKPMTEYIIKNYELSQPEAEEIAYDILNQAGAKVGFKTKYSPEC